MFQRNAVCRMHFCMDSVYPSLEIIQLDKIMEVCLV